MSQTLKFLVGREYKGQINSNKSCYYKKNGVLFLINCGKGVVDAMQRTKVLQHVKDVYVVITCSNKAHLEDIKKFFAILKVAKITPKIINSPSVNGKLLKKMGLKEKDDFKLIEPLKDNVKWINFLATPHKDKNMSCPVELHLDGKNIFYAGDASLVPFGIKGYDEYYFDFSGLKLKDEYAINPITIRNLIQKNKIKKQQLWLVHLQNMQALQFAQKYGVQVAEEEQAKIQKIQAKKSMPTKAPVRKAPTQPRKKEVSK